MVQTASGHISRRLSAGLVILLCSLVSATVLAAPPPKVVTIEVQGSGSVDVDPPGGVYDRGTVLTLTATPDAGWAFDHWEGAAIHGSTSNPESYQVSRNITLTAFFVPDGPGGGLDGVRTGDAVIRVLDGGAPAAGVDVQVDMTGIAFGFGTAVAAAPLDEPDYARWLRENYNWAVAENANKWPSNEPAQGAVSYANADKIYDFAAANGIRMRGHTVFWAVPQFVQQWVQDLDDAGLQAAMDARVADAVGHYDGKFEHWDVNNEMLHGSFFADRLGAGIRAWMFNQVKALDPEVKTFVNDYNIVSCECEADDYAQQISDLLAGGAQIDGIGVQGHFTTQSTPAQITARLDTLAGFGLPIWITEYDYEDPDVNARADFLEIFYRTAFAHPSVEGILMWGFWAGAHWRPDAALLDLDFTVNAAGQRYQALRAEWWTHTAGVSDGAGEVAFNGFYGDYAVTLSDGVNPPEIHHLSFGGDGPASFDLELGTGTPADLAAPVPNPAEWASPPTGVTRDVVAMEAVTATDPSGVEYHFANLDDPEHDSGWQASPEYRDSGLDPEQTYTYQVRTRDLSLGRNETTPSPAQAGTTGSDDGNLFANEGFEYGSTQHYDTVSAAISAQADTVRSGDYAARVANRAANWEGIGQNLAAHAVQGATWTCSGWMRLEGAASALAGMTLQIRDQAGDHYTGIFWTTANDSGWTELAGQVAVSWSGALQLARVYFEGPDPGIDFIVDDVACYADTVGSTLDMHVADLAMGLVQRGPNTNATVTVRIVDEFGAPVVGAAVSGGWSGLVSGSVGGNTNGAGEISFSSPKTKASGTFTFTVQDVAEAGYNYTPANNVETADSVSTP